MAYDQLWAPWRLAYIEMAKESGTTADGCFLCRYREDPSHDGFSNIVKFKNEVLTAAEGVHI